ITYLSGSPAGRLAVRTSCLAGPQYPANTGPVDRKMTNSGRWSFPEFLTLVAEVARNGGYLLSGGERSRRRTSDYSGTTPAIEKADRTKH
ncbi:MAG TPA: hypothetical protein VK466_04635, partial [Terriglobales bacterium]|nr:hypothetical protein [Terriglobales bacterium]